jgi:hypothetical protein
MNEEMTDGQKMIWAAAYVKRYSETADVVMSANWAFLVLTQSRRATLDIKDNGFLPSAHRLLCEMLGESV